MVSFAPKKLQVFVSSTFTDLITERQAAVEAILTAGHIPAGMELFTSGDESQMAVIKQWIDESDVYLLILGGRYGSVESNTGKSYTQLEYEYAVSKGKALFACVITDAARERHVKEHGTSVVEMDNPQKLKDFRAFVLTKMCKFWDDTKDIKLTIIEALAQFSRRDDLIGWVRPTQEANMPALADEIARLSKENADLRGQLANVGKGDSILGLSFDELYTLLENKDLLGFLIENRLELADDPGISSRMIQDSKLALDLAQLGLVSAYRDTSSTFVTSYYSLTEAGRIFLNKLEFRRLLGQ